ncbi:MAG: translation initiation factor IF-3 [Clostridia bacterium]|nr:translation initiation factor IF-3 [Clostridia bacterium]
MRISISKIIKTEVSIIATNNSSEQPINEQIRDKQVFLIDENGEKCGVTDTAVALRMAEERDLDLVLIAAQNPPVCRIMDYSKYRFEKMKREKEQRKNQKVMELKEIRLSPTIDVHDLEVKAKSCRKFLKNGDKVKVTIRFRGRQMTHNDLGHEVFDAFMELVGECAQVDRAAKMEGRSLIMILMPKAQK